MWKELAEWIRSDEAKAELKKETLWKQLIAKAFELTTTGCVAMWTDSIGLYLLPEYAVEICDALCEWSGCDSELWPSLYSFDIEESIKGDLVSFETGWSYITFNTF